MAKAGLQFKVKDEYNTPKKVVDYFGQFDYDPATTEEQARYLGILNYDTIETDGRIADWAKYQDIFINPPFSLKFDFLEKAVKTIKTNSETRIVFLIPFDSICTKSFYEIMKGVKFDLYIPNGRIKFESDSGSKSPAFGTAIVVMGREVEGEVRMVEGLC